MKSVSSTVSSLVSTVVPWTELEILVTISLATRFVIPALAPVSLKRTGTGRPMRKIELPFARIGARKNVPSVGAWYCTQTVKLAVLRLPTLSAAVHVTTVLPTGNVVPDTREQVTGRVPSTASTAFGNVYVTFAPAVLVAKAVI